VTAATLHAPRAAAEPCTPAAAPPRLERVGSRDQASLDDVLGYLADLSDRLAFTAPRRHYTLRGARSILRWLDQYPGEGWGQRWIAAGAHTGLGWMHKSPEDWPDGASSDRTSLAAGIGGLWLARVVVPAYDLIAEFNAPTRCSPMSGVP
jgi:hypothetical protein